ncbi:MAG: single-stranded DNA-binding protein [Ignavibacteria bacterium]|nr:single-stranded DNA-binding protein [Ignavibacteria bacterium]
MSRTLNKVMLIGNVGKDPELKYTPSGIPVTSFRLATSETWKDRDNNVQEHTDWHTIVAWRGLAEVIHKLIKKGSRVYIEGKIQTRNFDDKTGNHRHVVEVLAENMLLLDHRRQREDGHPDSEKDDYDELLSSHSLDFEPADFHDNFLDEFPSK